MGFPDWKRSPGDQVQAIGLGGSPELPYIEAAIKICAISGHVQLAGLFSTVPARSYWNRVYLITFPLNAWLSYA